ncbi:MAG TPA: GNAT family N-acetyltransferase [Rudaea sp.]|jgi:predicted GNAT family acetyltransferase|uniref:GNAT family N-acetyltransferase n=1 Tax=Rudaea sp. TaxID=2136325 RepID=UPI002F95BEDC
MNHPLDNPVWESLTSHHAGLARKTANAARYPADAAPFVAVDEPNTRAAAQLTSLVEVDETVLFVGPAPPLPPIWSVEPLVFIAQMTCDSRLAVNDGPSIIELSRAHVADMLALTALVYPHYFRPRTIEMGRYFGIYDGNTLAAMAGERMRFGRYQEISAICTHPDYTGRGYAQRLTATLTNDILDSGRSPFLHVSHANTRAKSLYERMGYRFRTDIPLLGVKRVARGES